MRHYTRKGPPIKRTALTVLLLLFWSGVAVANESYIVSGTISGIEEEGTLYVALLDQTRWDDPTGEDTKSREGYAQGFSEEVTEHDHVTYTLENVPPGSYAIRAFVDTNDNETLDMGVLGPREPWGVYRATGRIVGPPRFSNLCFDVEADLRDADFELR